MEIIGSVVLVDVDGQPYKAGTEPVVNTQAPPVLGLVQLIDPATGDPYNV